VLYTHTACPFAQRVWIALEASGIEYKKVDVNLCARSPFMTETASQSSVRD
jgi:glutathione S-transferase